ncbi:MAG: nucleoside-triphosphatase [Acidobacteriota bacterium]
MRLGFASAALFLACISVFLPWWWAPFAGCALAIAATAWVDRSVLRSALRLGFVLAAVFAAAVGGSAVAWSSGLVKGFEAGGLLLARLLVLWLVAGVVSRSVDADVVLGVFRKLGFERLGLVFGLALNALPRLVVAGRQVWIAHRVRSVSRIEAWKRLPALAEVLLAHTVRIGDDAAAAAALRGHSSLVRPPKAILVCPAPVIVLTGRPGSGKTTALERIIDSLVGHGNNVAGLIQPGEFRDGAKVGFSIRDLRTGEEAPLARRTSRESGQHGTGFLFDEAGLDLARQALASVPEGAVLVVDELGPVELRGKGHMPALRRTLALQPPRVLILVVRRHLVPALLAALSATDARVVDVESEGDEAVTKVVALVGEVEA